MQGAKHEFEASLALGVLKGDCSLGKYMECLADNHVDWDYVKSFIAAHKHEYPDYKE